MKLTFDVPEEMAEKIGEEIKAALEEYKKKQGWPQEGDRFFHLRGDGMVLTDRYNESVYSQILRFGNCFKTFEEAQFKAEQLKVLHELEQLADDDQPWSPKHSHWDIYFDRVASRIHLDYHNNNKYSQYMFKSKESAQEAIDKIGEDRLKKYYFCIPEE